MIFPAGVRKRIRHSFGLGLRDSSIGHRVHLAKITGVGAVHDLSEWSFQTSMRRVGQDVGDETLLDVFLGVDPELDIE